MNTPTQSRTVYTTTRGEPYFPSDVVTARYGKQPSSLRIVLSCGEALNDHYPDEVSASSQLERITAAMRGIVSTSAPSELPFWATPKNATIVSTTVLDAGGTRERAAQAYARTLMGIGEPASAIDTDNMKQRFNEALADESTPVLVLAGMDDPDHSKTKDPLTKHSPLVRLTLLAVTLHEVNPERLIFEVPNEHTSEGANKYTPSFHRGAMFTFGEDGLDLEGVTAPRQSYYWCQLNGAFFHEWSGLGTSTLVKVPDTHPLRVEFDVDNPAHCGAVMKLAEHFHKQGFDDAADRLLNVLGLVAHADGPR